MKISLTSSITLSLAVFLASALSGQAAAVSYSLSTSLSSLTLSGALLAPALPFGPQGGAASMTATYGGTLAGDLIGSTFTFGAGTAFGAAANPGAPFLPSPGTAPGPDNYGITIGLATAAYRGIAFTITGSATAGSTTGSMAMAFLAGSHSDYDATALGAGVGTVDLFATPPTTNTAAGLVSITVSGLTETITIPVSITQTGTIAGAPYTQTFAGSIVGTRAIPEPSALTFGLLGMLGLLRRKKH